MTDQMDTAPAPAAAGATPWHLWVVGVLSLLWNAFGGYDFVMSMTQREAYWRKSGFTEEMVTYFNAMPGWMMVPWVIGVWGAVIGSILLLMRSRWAVHAFGLSLIGAAVSTAYHYMSGGPQVMAPMGIMAHMTLVILAIAAFLAWYAWTMSKRGVLR